jgi:hypothetical protein
VLFEDGVPACTGAGFAAYEGVVGARGDLDFGVLGQNATDRFDPPAVFVFVDEHGRSLQSAVELRLREKRHDMRVI